MKAKDSKASLLTAATLVMIFILSVSVAYAFKPADRQKLKTSGSCPSCDLSGAYFRGTTLNSVYLRGANLSGADLSNTSLKWANLSTTDLTNADLSGANLSYANLTGANLTGANISGAKLTGANFYGATWTDGSSCKTGSVGACN